MSPSDKKNVRTRICCCSFKEGQGDVPNHSIEWELPADLSVTMSQLNSPCSQGVGVVRPEGQAVRAAQHS